MSIRIGSIKETYSARGIPTYSIEMSHEGLNKHRVVKDRDMSIVLRKVELLKSEWTDRWEATQERQRKREERANLQEHREAQKADAQVRTSEAAAELEAVDTLLAHTLSVDDAIDWSSLEDTTPFPEAKPKRKPDPLPPDPPSYPAEPRAAEFSPKYGVLDKLMRSRREGKDLAAEQQFKAAHREWKDHVARLRTGFESKLITYKELLDERTRDHEEALQDWETRRHAFEEDQHTANANIHEKKRQYLGADPEAVVEYCDLVLSNSKYPDWLPHEWDLDYNDDTRSLVVEYRLPSLDDVPTLQEVKYIQSRDEFTEKRLSDAATRKLYDSAVYQVVLRTIHELFEADTAKALDAIVFNGRVTSIDRTTGHKVDACIVSLHAKKTEFLEINLAQVEPKACFKALKGVGSTKLHSLTPVAPIMELRRDDGRFVSSREVANTLDESANLAAMDWEEFEHLIREVFEKEFATNGGEVKVTQASRDGGVDAIAFDPDPIRGGKIVIQAKRYTNTVGVAAVRDLYGTVVNEGATKGILVTTSDYGPDAYSFAKDKPLALLSGANLLHLLEKHGHRAKIDIAEARRMMGRG